MSTSNDRLLQEVVQTRAELEAQAKQLAKMEARQDEMWETLHEIRGGKKLLFWLLAFLGGIATLAVALWKQVHG
ncbi:MAG: hypothetical protein ACTS10_10915 [Kiloniellales bacterium]